MIWSKEFGDLPTGSEVSVELKGTGSAAAQTITVTVTKPCTIYTLFDVFLNSSSPIFSVTLNGTAVSVSDTIFNVNVSSGWGWSGYKFEDLDEGDTIVMTARNTGTGYPVIITC